MFHTSLEFTFYVETAVYKGVIKGKIKGGIEVTGR